MILIGAAVVLVLLAALALVPTDRLPGWLGVYIGVAIASSIVVVLVAMFA
jgi:hypothetical protein